MIRTSADCLLYFAPVHWDSYPQRPHYFARYFLERGGTRVIWVDPYLTRLPRLDDLAKPRRVRLSFPRPPGLTVISLRSVPLEPLRVGRWLNHRILWEALRRRVAPLVRGMEVRVGIGRPSALAVAALEAFGTEDSFYDAMDDFPEFYRGVSKTSARLQERKIVEAVELVVTSSAALWEKFSHPSSRRIMIRNGFNMAALPPLPIARNGHKVFGYVGCISHWFDWPLVQRLALAFPDVDVRIVGPCYTRPTCALAPNITVLPECTEQRAIEHCRDFSVGLIPFKANALTDGVDPIKYYTYRGMGLPVLSTAFGEMAKRGTDDGVFLLNADTDLATAAAASLEAYIDPASTSRFRRDHTWERSFEQAGVFERVVARPA